MDNDFKYFIHVGRVLTSWVEMSGIPNHIEICFSFELCINCHKYMFCSLQFYLEYRIDHLLVEIRRMMSLYGKL